VNVIYVPHVPAAAYPALEDLVQSGADYIDWLRQIAHWQQGAALEGCVVREIPVEASGFKRYLDAKGFPYNRTQLIGYAEWFGSRMNP
jgi:hypothetical protein